MSKRRKLFAFAIDASLKKGLTAVKKRDGISESEQTRRAIQQWLADRKVAAPASSTRNPRTGRKGTK